MKKCYHRLAGIALLTLSLPVGAWAQDIRGMVVDSKTQEPLVGATVQVKGTSLGVATDIDGKFHFEGLDKSKSYTLVIQYVSYKTKNIDGVRTKADGAEDDLRITLSADEQQLGDVTVTAVKRLNTDAAMIDAARTSSVIVSNVSAQEPNRPEFRPELTRHMCTCDVVRYSMVPMRFIKKIYKVKKYVQGSMVFKGSVPATPLLNSQYTSSFIAGLAELRYLHEMPLENAVEHFRSHGFDLDKGTAHKLVSKTKVQLENLYP